MYAECGRFAMKDKFYVGQLVNVVPADSVERHFGIGVQFWREAHAQNPHEIVCCNDGSILSYHIKDSCFEWPEYGLEPYDKHELLVTVEDLL